MKTHTFNIVGLVGTEQRASIRKRPPQRQKADTGFLKSSQSAIQVTEAK
ncbi:MAG TPA: hypothetical protein VEX38_05810 [Fimbriimonadaceae bacterium]|nr:hypothetical protein [Fimbriimonadaceae bacterium]